MGDTLADSGTFYFGIHKGATGSTSPVLMKQRPAKTPKTLSSHVYTPFNASRQYAVSHSIFHKEFSNSGLLSSNELFGTTPTHVHRPKQMYALHRSHNNQRIFAGADAYSVDGLLYFSKYIAILDGANF